MVCMYEHVCRVKHGTLWWEDILWSRNIFSKHCPIFSVLMPLWWKDYCHINVSLKTDFIVCMYVYFCDDITREYLFWQRNYIWWEDTCNMGFIGLTVPCDKICILIWFSMWDGFFSPQVSESHRSRLRRRWNSETSDEKSISHGKRYKMHFLTNFTITGRHINHAKYITQSWISWKPCGMDLSHNCYQLWSKVGSMRECSLIIFNVNNIIFSTHL